MKLIKRDYSKSYHENLAYRESENSQRNHQRLQALLEHKTGGSLLEIGCGMGGFLRMAEQHFAVEGMDVSSYAVEAMRPHFGERVRVYNVEQRPLPREQYHVIAVFNILEHLRQPNKVIDKISAALQPDGLLIGSVPNNQGVVGGLVTRLGNFVDRTHVSTFTPDVWQRMFNRSGFRSIDFFGEITLGRNRCRYIRRPIWPHISFNLMFVCKK